MSDFHQILIEVRRSSGKKEWITKAELSELNKQRAIKREKSKSPEKQHWNGLKA